MTSLTAGAPMSSSDHMTAAAGDDGYSCSPSSVTIVDLDATIDDDRGAWEQADDVEHHRADSSRPPTTTSSPLRVPTPSSWEKYRLVASSLTSSHRHDDLVAQSGATDVKKLVVPADRRRDASVKDDVDTRRSSTLNKPCSCGALTADTSQVDYSVHVVFCDCTTYRLWPLSHTNNLVWLQFIGNPS